MPSRRCFGKNVLHAAGATTFSTSPETSLVSQPHSTYSNTTRSHNKYINPQHIPTLHLPPSSNKPIMASENLSDLPALPKSPIDATANATHNADERSEFPSTNNTKGKKTLAPEGDVVGPDTLAKSTPSKTATSILDSDEEGLSDPPPSSDGDDDERDMDFDPNELTSSSRKKLKPRERAAALAAGPRPDSDGEDEEEDTFPVRASRSKRKGKETEKRSHQKKSHKKTVSKKRNSDIFREDGEEAVVERADVKKPRRNTAVGLVSSNSPIRFGMRGIPLTLTTRSARQQAPPCIVRRLS